MWSEQEEAVFGAAWSQTALSKVSPTLSSGSLSLGLGQKREMKCSPSPQSGEKVLRSKSPIASQSVLQKLPCLPRGAIVPVLEAEALLAQADLLSGLATQGSLFPHPLFRQLTSALLGRAIK